MMADVAFAGKIHRERHRASILRNALRSFDLAIGNHDAPTALDHEPARRFADAIPTADHHGKALGCQALDLVTHQAAACCTSRSNAG
ncbi:MAG TPA: hypothetical protein VJX31_05435 [Casimicrobiaceae bacterium]|nr:hypothetical protein [Casimicrobiaceae bacterium]